MRTSAPRSAPHSSIPQHKSCLQIFHSLKLTSSFCPPSLFQNLNFCLAFPTRRGAISDGNAVSVMLSDSSQSRSPSRPLTNIDGRTESTRTSSLRADVVSLQGEDTCTDVRRRSFSGTSVGLSTVQPSGAARTDRAVAKAGRRAVPNNRHGTGAQGAPSSTGKCGRDRCVATGTSGGDACPQLERRHPKLSLPDHAGQLSFCFIPARTTRPQIVISELVLPAAVDA